MTEKQLAQARAILRYACGVIFTGFYAILGWILYLFYTRWLPGPFSGIWLRLSWFLLAVAVIKLWHTVLFWKSPND
jgi:hypothetical protein